MNDQELIQAMREIIADLAEDHTYQDPDYGHVCIFCKGPYDWNQDDSILHDPDCLIVKARAIMAMKPYTNLEQQ